MTSQQGSNFKMATALAENEEDVFDDFVQNEPIIEPYMFELNKDDERYSSEDSSEDSYDEEDEYNDEFKRANSWRLTTLSWCKCGKCSLMEKTIESFCCHEKSLKYDEYDDILKKVESKKFTCITDSSAFQQNMLSRDVLCVDVSQYMEENWPLGDEELERTHKLYRLVSYKRCSRWIFGILGKKIGEFFLRVYIHVLGKSFRLHMVYTPILGFQNNLIMKIEGISEFNCS